MGLNRVQKRLLSFARTYKRIHLSEAMEITGKSQETLRLLEDIAAQGCLKRDDSKVVRFWFVKQTPNAPEAVKNQPNLFT